MEQQKIDMFLTQNASKFPGEKIMLIKDALAKVDDSKAMSIQTLDLKDPTTGLILSILSTMSIPTDIFTSSRFPNPAPTMIWLLRICKLVT